MSLVKIKRRTEVSKEDMKDWCYLNVGMFRERWDFMTGPELPVTYWFTFADDEDAMVFRLRFGL